ncbi:DUF4124 domain-containing protein [Luteimonas yindakuii]|uniref:DUF4124 domain-containing protein n=1 Tax=Luteimonas yindakuii TaxID=2565782 RepID=A0A4Z1RFS6_9GAMM|nr:DUF4124 domain-containing protein [Luteimonas yindakuii]QCO66931.1 DUF4124 domain-containing protein [Luteimonas yindakuii]TKS52939.1 DUF4124 domain-containing protein [Luteimonas yindakuii]
MRHPLTGLALGLVAALLAGAAGAQDIYQWKDSRGVTHYSEAPPGGGEKYTHRRVTPSGATQAQPASTATAAAAPVAANAAAGNDPRAEQCRTARANIEALNGTGPVQQDDGSGTPRTLNDAERAAQLEFAQAAARAYCS